VDCILWEAVAKKFIEHCKNRAESGPMIIIFRRARLILPTGYMTMFNSKIQLLTIFVL
jgi:hypothetical protein